ncbi:hypothetical protein E1A91_D10G223600v1 [Gossypium mustelinum]|uniref:Uncharacterized protein n=1 Tax=Gossypium mustelinum TaxID=34275 RepID=A0A5D2TB80_GOSMU|nr:hypothetical protein E1A91_D10G223300v1 [Gossypium mustelinum]TYI62125.1 hypothetical protein E1A91_D10G223600v1 [Gossypium mustelinum]
MVLIQELKQKLLLMNMVDGVGVILGLCSGSIVASGFLCKSKDKTLEMKTITLVKGSIASKADDNSKAFLRRALTSS